MVRLNGKLNGVVMGANLLLSLQSLLQLILCRKRRSSSLPDWSSGLTSRASSAAEFAGIFLAVLASVIHKILCISQDISQPSLLLYDILPISTVLAQGDFGLTTAIDEHVELFGVKQVASLFVVSQSCASRFLCRPGV